MTTELYREHVTIPPHVHFQPNSDKPKERTPRGYKWSGDFVVPAIGARVRSLGVGIAEVCGYFTEHGYLGLIVRPLSPPEWYVRQNGRRATCHVFGAECEGT